MRYTIALLSVVLLAVASLPALAIDQAHRTLGQTVEAKAIKYLRSTQGDDGSWTPQPGPAVTAMAIAGLLGQDGVALDDSAVAKGLKYILDRQKDNGGIYDRILANYNTSICLMALGRIADRHEDARIKNVVKRAQDYLRNLQWADDKKDSTGQSTDKQHPFYGGAGYGKHGRPDLSNTSIMIAGLHDSGLSCKDPAYQRAMVFITALQGTKVNTTFGDKIVPDGGFIYSTSRNKDNIGVPESKAGAVIDSAGRSRLRTYGSMTYAGFMSYLYARLDRNDVRVRDAYEWIQRRYTLNENPGVGMQGYYYYLHLFARAMRAFSGNGENTTITLRDGTKRDWANDLIDKLAKLQRVDGSFFNEKDRWMEGDANLCSAYAILAIQHAMDSNTRQSK